MDKDQLRATQARKRAAAYRARKRAASVTKPLVKSPAPDVDVYRPDFDFSIYDPSKPGGLSDYGLWLIVARGYDT